MKIRCFRSDSPSDFKLIDLLAFTRLTPEQFGNSWVSCSFMWAKWKIGKPFHMILDDLL